MSPQSSVSHQQTNAGHVLVPVHSSTAADECDPACGSREAAGTTAAGPDKKQLPKGVLSNKQGNLLIFAPL
ncbi:hypothetical protein [Niabella soli]|nr:hypothetical protein [Niabella soli]